MQIEELRKKIGSGEITHFRALNIMVERGIISPSDVRNIEKHFMPREPRKLTEKELKERKIAIRYGTYVGILEKKGEKAYELPEEWRTAITKYLKKQK